jgi:glycosyltransferase involved in cell wall biosynthesis
LSAQPTRLAIIMPVYNDWDSFERLIADLEVALTGALAEVHVLAVDDGSTSHGPAEVSFGPIIRDIRVLRLGANVGHQRAIAVGLMHVSEGNAFDLIAVMDSDGEDRPSELKRLLDEAKHRPGVAIVAERRKRSESLLFRTFYWLYRRLFTLLTGQRIRFGNFSLLPARHVSRIINSSHVWNNFAATLVQSRLPIRYVPTERGSRYSGRSSMNFVSLVAHGLGAISVFSEAVFIRILIASTLVFGASVLIAAIALYLKLFTPVAIPGWATNVIGFAVLISLQALMTPILVAFLLLSNRGMVQPLPKTVALALIEEEHALSTHVPGERAFDPSERTLGERA